MVALRTELQCESVEDTETACGLGFVEQFLEAEVPMTVVVDGSSREGPGAVDLSIGRCATYTPATQPATPPDPNGETQLVEVLPIDDATVTSLPSFAPGCRPPDASETPAVAAWLFTASESARFRFDTSGSPVATRLAVRAGLTCTGSDRACVNVVDDPDDAIELELMAGETIVIVVETLGGPSDYRLAIQRVFM